METALEPWSVKYSKMQLFETLQMFYLIASDEAETSHRILKIDRRIEKPKSLDLVISEDGISYTNDELTDLLSMIDDGNKATGGLIKLTSAYGLVGFVKFLDCYYFTLITQRKLVGRIGSSDIYTIKATEMFAVKPREEPDSNVLTALWRSVNKRLNQSNVEVAEARYIGLFQFVDMSKDFFFSYSYDMTNSLQYNYIMSSKRAQQPPTQEMFEWNFYQTEELSAIIEDSEWILPLVHGSYQQRQFSSFGRPMDVILIARRSRHYAGTRYLKRGVSVHGKVANDVEVEQVLQVDSGKRVILSSYLQMRGSIPTYWHQETSVTQPKPPILINRRDPSYLATQEHFADLLRRYNSPIIVLDLVKQHERKPRESIIGKDFRDAVNELNVYIPLKYQIRYLALDYTRISKMQALQNVYAATTPSEGIFEGLVGGSAAAQDGIKPDDLGREWALVENALGAGTEVEVVSREAIASQKQQQQQRKNFAAISTSAPTAAAMSSSTVSSKSLSQTSQGRAASGRRSDDTAGAKALDALREMEDITSYCVVETGIFCSHTEHLEKASMFQREHVAEARLKGHMEQKGVLRTNCVDCLDRTNVAQFLMGTKFLTVALRALGLRDDPAREPSSPFFLGVMDMYSELGDRIALQYGGSEAHKKMAATRGKLGQTQKQGQGELLTSIKRYYSNAFTDMVKQDAMNVFLGNFIPAYEPVPLWDLESDYHLHNLDLAPPPPAENAILFNDNHLGGRQDAGWDSDDDDEDKAEFAPHLRSRGRSSSSIGSGSVGGGDIFMRRVLRARLQKHRDGGEVLQLLAAAPSVDPDTVVENYIVNTRVPMRLPQQVKRASHKASPGIPDITPFHESHQTFAVADSNDNINIRKVDEHPEPVTAQVTVLHDLSPTEINRAIIRCEKRKYVGRIMSERVAEAMGRWWREAIEEHYARRRIDIGDHASSATAVDCFPLFSSYSRNTSVGQSHAAAAGFSTSGRDSRHSSRKFSLNNTANSATVTGTHTPESTELYFQRVYKPDELTSFDAIAELDFEKPLEVKPFAVIFNSASGGFSSSTAAGVGAASGGVLSAGDMLVSGDQGRRVLRSIPSEYGDFVPQPAEAGGGVYFVNEENRALEPVLFFSSSSTTFLSNSLLSTIPFSESAAPVNSVPEIDPVDYHLGRQASFNSRYHNDEQAIRPVNAEELEAHIHQTTQSQVHNKNQYATGGRSEGIIGKYVRDLSQKARSLFSSKESPTAAADDTASAQKIKGSTYSLEEDRFNIYCDPDLIFTDTAEPESFVQPVVSDESSLLYTSYAKSAADPLLLMQSQSLPGIISSEPDFVEAFREININVDSVCDMEQFQAEAHASTIVTSGIYAGLHSWESAKAASAFIFTSLANVETDATFDDDALVGLRHSVAELDSVGTVPSLERSPTGSPLGSPGKPDIWVDVVSKIQTHSSPVGGVDTSVPNVSAAPTLSSLWGTESAPPAPIVNISRGRSGNGNNKPAGGTGTASGSSNGDVNAPGSSAAEADPSKDERRDRRGFLPANVKKKLLSLATAHRAGPGLEGKLLREANRSHRQGLHFSRSLDYNRLSRRFSSLSSEDSVLLSTIGLDKDSLASNVNEINFILSDRIVEGVRVAAADASTSHVMSIKAAKEAEVGGAHLSLDSDHSSQTWRDAYRDSGLKDPQNSPGSVRWEVDNRESGKSDAVSAMGGEDFTKLEALLASIHHLHVSYQACRQKQTSVEELSTVQQPDEIFPSELQGADVNDGKSTHPAPISLYGSSSPTIEAREKNVSSLGSENMPSYNTGNRKKRTKRANSSTSPQRLSFSDNLGASVKEETSHPYRGDDTSYSRDSKFEVSVSRGGKLWGDQTMLDLNPDYDGFTFLSTDLYTKTSNPFLVMNEIAVQRYNEAMRGGDSQKRLIIA